MSNISDLQSLFSLVRSNSLFKTIYETYLVEILNRVLATSDTPLQCQKLMVTTLSARQQCSSFIKSALVQHPGHTILYLEDQQRWSVDYDLEELCVDELSPYFRQQLEDHTLPPVLPSNLNSIKDLKRMVSMLSDADAVAATFHRKRLPTGRSKKATDCNAVLSSTERHRFNVPSSG